MMPWDEHAMAEWAGMERQLAALSMGLVDRHPAAYDDDDTRMDKHVLGACAENQAARDTDRYWAPNVGKIGEPDLLCGYQVRLAIRHGGQLILRPHTKDETHRDVPWVLVTGEPPDLVTRGWIVGGDAMVSQFLGEYARRKPDCWHVPQSHLRPISELRR